MNELEDRRHSRWEWTRVLEVLLPMFVVGALSLYVNSIITKDQAESTRSRVEKLEEKVTRQNEELIKLAAQMTAYLGQQTSLNSAMESRMTYIERNSGIRK